MRAVSTISWNAWRPPLPWLVLVALSLATAVRADGPLPPADRCGQPVPPPAMDIDNTCARSACHATPGTFQTGSVNLSLHELGSMDEIAKVAERNASTMNTVVDTAHAQVNSMNEVVASSNSLTELAEKLRGVLRRFDTGQTDPESAA